MRKTFVGLVMLVRLCVTLPSLVLTNGETVPTCFLDVIHTRFEHNTSLYYL
jgi:hypothetical protein